MINIHVSKRIFLLLIIFLSFSSVSHSSTNYSKNWRIAGTNGRLNILIAPDVSSLQPGSKTNFSITFSTLAFDPSQANYSFFKVQLRLLIGNDTFYSDIGKPESLLYENSTTTTNVTLSLPDNNHFRLSNQQSIRSILEYEFNFSVGLKSSIYVNHTSSWTIISEPDVTYALDLAENTLLFMLVVLTSVIIFLSYSIYKSNKKLNSSQNTSPNLYYGSSQLFNRFPVNQNLLQFCTYCGTKIQPDYEFCTNCGKKLQKQL